MVDSIVRFNANLIANLIRWLRLRYIFMRYFMTGHTLVVCVTVIKKYLHEKMQLRVREGSLIGNLTRRNLYDTLDK